MDLHQLKYFQKLATILHFTKTADELALSQPALSRSISRLEQELGVPLFERKSRGLILNNYGEIFLRHVNQALWEIAEAKQEITNMINPDYGTISLAFIQPLGSSFVPNLIGSFQKQKPEIKFHLTQDTTKKILDQVQSSKVDIGFCTAQEPIEGLDSLPIMNQELFLIVPKGHRLSNQEQADLCEVAGDPFVLYKPETSLHDMVEKLCRDAGFQPKMSFEAFEERTVAGLVGANFGVALVPFLPGLDLQKISLIRVRNPNCVSVLQMVWRTNSYISPAVMQFKTYVESTQKLTD